MCVDREGQAVCNSALQVLGKAELFPAGRASVGLKDPFGGVAVFGARLNSPADPQVLCRVRFGDPTMAECWVGSGLPAWAGASWACGLQMGCVTGLWKGRLKMLNVLGLG